MGCSERTHDGAALKASPRILPDSILRKFPASFLVFSYVTGMSHGLQFTFDWFLTNLSITTSIFSLTETNLESCLRQT